YPLGRDYPTAEARDAEVWLDADADGSVTDGSAEDDRLADRNRRAGPVPRGTHGCGSGRASNWRLLGSVVPARRRSRCSQKRRDRDVHRNPKIPWHGAAPKLRGRDTVACVGERIAWAPVKDRPPEPTSRNPAGTRPRRRPRCA